jgi:hypothetical protein
MKMSAVTRRVGASLSMREVQLSHRDCPLLDPSKSHAGIFMSTENLGPLTTRVVTGFLLLPAMRDLPQD